MSSRADAREIRELAARLRGVVPRLNIAADRWEQHHAPAAFAEVAEIGDAVDAIAADLLAWRRRVAKARRAVAVPLSLPEPAAHE